MESLFTTLVDLDRMVKERGFERPVSRPVLHVCGGARRGAAPPSPRC
jgi:hypothetical protein